MSLEQLTLGFRLRDDATFASFLPTGNEEILSAVINNVRGIGDPFIYLWGPLASGRSHLLQATCHAAPEFRQTAVYLPLEPPQTLRADLFNGLENVDLVCIDDLEQIAGDALWEEKLFHLFNRLRANNKRLIIAAAAAPISLNIKLPDLKSRLSWGVTYHLHVLDDEQKLAALKLRAQCRGLDLEPAVGKFLLRRCGRNMVELFNVLEQLDEASLAEQRRLTIPFVKEVLKV